MSVETIRSFLTINSFTQFIQEYNFDTSEYSLDDIMLFYTHYLVAFGHIDSLSIWLHSVYGDDCSSVVNQTHPDLYLGNTLHTCCYWLNGQDAVDMYYFLISLGARPVRDYYDSYPWQSYGQRWIFCGRELTTELRDENEFTETFRIIENIQVPYSIESSEMNRLEEVVTTYEY